MIRVIHARNDLLTSFDLRAQIFRVNAEFSTCYHGHKKFSKKWPKVTFRLEKKIFLGFLKPSILRHKRPKKSRKKFFRAERSLSFIFSNFFFDFCGPGTEAFRWIRPPQGWIQTEMNSLTQNTKKDIPVLWLNKGQVTNCTKNTNIYWHYKNLAKHDNHFSIEHRTYEFLSYLQKKLRI